MMGVAAMLGAIFLHLAGHPVASWVMFWLAVIGAAIGYWTSE